MGKLMEFVVMRHINSLFRVKVPSTTDQPLLLHCAQNARYFSLKRE